MASLESISCCIALPDAKCEPRCNNNRIHPLPLCMLNKATIPRDVSFPIPHETTHKALALHYPHPHIPSSPHQPPVPPANSTRPKVM